MNLTVDCWKRGFVCGRGKPKRRKTGKEGQAARWHAGTGWQWDLERVGGPQHPVGCVLVPAWLAFNIKKIGHSEVGGDPNETTRLTPEIKGAAHTRRRKNVWVCHTLKWSLIVLKSQSSWELNKVKHFRCLAWCPLIVACHYTLCALVQRDRITDDVFTRECVCVCMCVVGAEAGKVKEGMLSHQP